MTQPPNDPNVPSQVPPPTQPPHPPTPDPRPPVVVNAPDTGLQQTLAEIGARLTALPEHIVGALKEVTPVTTTPSATPAAPSPAAPSPVTTEKVRSGQQPSKFARWWHGAKS